MNQKLFLNLISMMVILLFELKLTQEAGTADVDQQWIQYKDEFNKHYTVDEDLDRKNQFVSNVRYISTHNEEALQGKHKYTLAVNQFADWYPSEYQRMLGYKPPTKNARRKRQAIYYENQQILATLPTHVNWTAEGWVNPVQNQGSCGACWSFSACGAMEGLLFNRTRRLVVLSEQNLIDCSIAEGNNGCDGGWMQMAFKYTQMNGGIDSAASYPYTMVSYNSSSNQAPYGSCKYEYADDVMTIVGWQNIESYNELALQQAVALTGPVSVAIDAILPSFQFYSSGVYSNEDCDPYYLDHAVLAVGYGIYNSSEYWLLKNSWGEGWGINGYMMLARNDNNMCGVASNASFPTSYSTSIPTTTTSYGSASDVFPSTPNILFYSNILLSLMLANIK